MTETFEIDPEILNRDKPDLSLSEKVEQLEERVNDLENQIESLTRRRDERSYIPDERFD